MSTLQLPFQLKEGTIAYASKVMANFEAILNGINNISIDGVSKTDLQTAISALKTLIDACVKIGLVGNAVDIVFTDGATLQEKLDSGDLNGTDGVSAYIEGWAAFDIDEYGHLIVTTATDETAFSIVDGNLIYTISDEETGTFKQYDLGKVKGEKGDSGDISYNQMVEYVSTQIANIAKSSTEYPMAFSASWNSDDNTCEVTCSGITASNNFIVDTNATATDSEIEAWEKAKPKVISQGVDKFTLRARGPIPTINIPLQVTINI